MFSRNIVSNDAFAMMPHSAQVLYTQLVMRADDDGFVDCANSVRLQFRCKKSDLQLLVDRKYLIRISDQLYLIRQWYTQNQIRKDRYKASSYLNQAASLLFIDAEGAYQLFSEAEQNLADMEQNTATARQPSGNPV